MEKKKTVRISRDALEFALEASKASHPHEFIGMLREEEGIIIAILVIPGSILGDGFSQLDYWQVPAHSGECGVLHSHPNGNALPSQADRNLFTKSGRIHAIAAYPYTERSICFYDGNGRKLEFEIV
ncbi:hypothetical protein COV61_03290 [Candidatus Micrarchaeota archaeon CG11_big_fil_rev_8_21_14_0_20_47_5]|nr:MAG: hypothetical protein COV61_03290 [Candidatus Micrarchaeota archaeon CG11_big_fil_rev_8_21_14_0_20_47_5]